MLHFITEILLSVSKLLTQNHNAQSRRTLKCLSSRTNFFFANWVFFLLKNRSHRYTDPKSHFSERKNEKSTNANGFMFATKSKESLKFKMSQESEENAWKRESEWKTDKKWIVKRTIFPELRTVQLLFAYFNIRMSTETQNEISWNGFKLFRIFSVVQENGPKISILFISN